MPRIRTLYLGIGGAVVAVLLVLALGVLLGIGTDSALAQTPKDTGNIAIFKTVCDDIGQQNTCKGHDNSKNNDQVDFAVFSGTTTVGTPVVTLGDNANGNGNVGNGSMGRIVSDPLPIGTYTVCEVDANYTAVPRPPAGGGGSTGGTNQTVTLVDGNQCITVQLTAGTAELKFLNQVVATATPPGQATPTNTPAPGTPTSTPVPGQPTNTPVPGQPEQPTSTPVTGQVVAPAPTATPVVEVLAVVEAQPTPSVLVLPAAGNGGLADTGLPLSLLAVNGLALAGLALAGLAGWRRRQ